MPTVLPTIQTEKNTFDFFQQHVKDCLKNQNITITTTSEHYLVSLLVDFTLTNKVFSLTENDNRPLAIIYHQAQLETTGFFPDSLNRKVTDVDYYMLLGKSAYENLSIIFKKNHKDSFTLLFDELAEKFVSIADILAEISSNSATKWDDGILRLYERWLKTRSKRDERLLCKKGIIPNYTLHHKVNQ
jgi:hypothetical protein